jgi:hypothetical protein
MSKVTDFKKGILTITNSYRSEDFIQTIQKEYHLVSTINSSGFYDFVALMIEAYEYFYKEKQIKPTAQEITTYIHNKKVFSCMSGTCVVNPNGFIVSDPIIRIFKDDRWIKIEE